MFLRHCWITAANNYELRINEPDELSFVFRIFLGTSPGLRCRPLQTLDINRLELDAAHGNEKNDNYEYSSSGFLIRNS